MRAELMHSRQCVVYDTADWKRAAGTKTEQKPPIEIDIELRRRRAFRNRL